MTRRLVPAVAAILAVAGLGHLAMAAYIPAKAALAQVLLRRAWDATVAAGAARIVQPWPGADTHPVARLLVPRLGVDMVVLAGTNGSVLAFGPGSLEAAGRPGAVGHVVLAGHRDTHFAFLEQVLLGERIQVQGADGRQRAYRVVNVQVADARVEAIDLDSARDRLTLVTCYPFHAVQPGGPLRWVVTADAEAVSEPEEQVAGGPGA